MRKSKCPAKDSSGIVTQTTNLSSAIERVRIGTLQSEAEGKHTIDITELRSKIK